MDSQDGATRLAGLRVLARVCEQPENHARGGASFGAIERLMKLLGGREESTEAQLAALQGLAALCAHARFTPGQLHTQPVQIVACPR
mgnify:CR=1 FL=1